MNFINEIIKNDLIFDKENMNYKNDYGDTALHEVKLKTNCLTNRLDIYSSFLRHANCHRQLKSSKCYSNMMLKNLKPILSVRAFYI